MVSARQKYRLLIYRTLILLVKCQAPVRIRSTNGAEWRQTTRHATHLRFTHSRRASRGMQRRGTDAADAVPDRTSAAPPTSARKPGDYPLGPDSLPQEGVPKGRLEGPFEFHSQIIAGTVRRYWIYVPAQYNREASRPTCWCSRTASAPRIRTGRCACRRSWRTSSPRRPDAR